MLCVGREDGWVPTITPAFINKNIYILLSHWNRILFQGLSFATRRFRLMLVLRHLLSKLSWTRLRRSLLHGTYLYLFLFESSII